MTAVTEVADGLSSIDLEFQRKPGVIASYLMESEGERALIEIGPTSSLDTLLEALQSMNVEPESIAKLVVTHIHLDHAGAAGDFIQRFPNVRLYVHEVGAPHLIDPSKLVASATRIWGDMMLPLWGRVYPVPEHNVVTVRDGDVITVGGKRLNVIYTPGHASHHVALHDQEAQALFTGDVTGVRLHQSEYVRPPTPPPELDLDLWSKSLEIIRNLHPQTLYLTHFGPYRDVADHLKQVEDRLYEWGDIVVRGMEQGEDRDSLVETLASLGDDQQMEITKDQDLIPLYELATPYGMTVDGYLRYFKRRG